MYLGFSGLRSLVLGSDAPQFLGLRPGFGALATFTTRLLAQRRRLKRFSKANDSETVS